MKKFIFAVSILCFSAFNVSAQKTFSKSDNLIGIGVGLDGTHLGKDYSSSPYFSLRYEKCVIDNLFNDRSSIGVGAIGGLWSGKIAGEVITSINLGARGALHYEFISKLDSYAGLNLNLFTKDAIDFHFGAYLGTRYYLTDKFAIFAEAGMGFIWLDNLTLGVSWKF